MLRPCFWDYDFGSLGWGRDRELIVARVLAAGDWDAVRWVWGRLGSTALAEHIRGTRGRGLDPRRLAFWSNVLALPRREVRQWVRARGDATWDRRLGTRAAPGRRPASR